MNLAMTRAGTRAISLALSATISRRLRPIPRTPKRLPDWRARVPC